MTALSKQMPRNVKKMWMCEDAPFFTEIKLGEPFGKGGGVGGKDSMRTIPSFPM
jgi:hypothetical protein